MKPKSKFWRNIGIAGLAIFFLLQIVKSLTPKEQVAAQEKAAEAYAAARAPMLSCVRSWEATQKQNLKDTESLKWDKDNFSMGTYKQGAKVYQVVVVPYRAKNSYGALTLHEAICELSADKTSTSRVIK